MLNFRKFLSISLVVIITENIYMTSTNKLSSYDSIKKLQKKNATDWLSSANTKSYVIIKLVMLCVWKYIMFRFPLLINCG